jgi:uracil-DNA glycosylase
MNLEIEHSWKRALKNELEMPYFKDLHKFIINEYETFRCYPELNDIFNAFNKCPISQVKVVIIGQDPYINPNQADGLCFSVNENVSIPPSLKNIFKELHSDLNIKNNVGKLTKWSEQGVLLLNDTLTVQAGKSNSHYGKGWSRFTSAAMKALGDGKKDLVYMLWGSFAQKKAKSVDASRNFILKSVHPSPLSAYRGFFGCRHFSKANEYLISKGKKPIDWQL